jgi:hypothetical protein
MKWYFEWMTKLAMGSWPWVSDGSEHINFIFLRKKRNILEIFKLSVMI